jgi:hypothetical protein
LQLFVEEKTDWKFKRLTFYFILCALLPGGMERGIDHHAVDKGQFAARSFSGVSSRKATWVRS